MGSELEHWFTCHHTGCPTCTYIKGAKESAWMEKIVVRVPPKEKK